jgi:hypothetical protein
VRITGVVRCYACYREPARTPCCHAPIDKRGRYVRLKRDEWMLRLTITAAAQIGAITLVRRLDRSAGARPISISEPGGCPNGPALPKRCDPPRLSEREQASALQRGRRPLFMLSRRLAVCTSIPHGTGSGHARARRPTLPHHRSPQLESRPRRRIPGTTTARGDVRIPVRLA